jgi:AcrR family transcriptional regulator
MKKNTKPNKQETMMRLSQAVFSLEQSQGHLQWKVTSLVRKANISRALVYRYFGSSKTEILLSALKVFTSEFYCFSGTTAGLSLSQRIRRAHEYVYKNPDAIIFYQIWRNRESIYQNEFLGIEKKFQKGLRKIFSHFSEQQILAAHTCIHGMVTAPFLNPELLTSVCEAFEEANILR